MAKRNRDYKAEYAKRKAKAQQEGYVRGYSQKRKRLEIVKREKVRITDVLTKRLLERTDLDLWDAPYEIEDILDWGWFRFQYKGGNQA